MIRHVKVDALKLAYETGASISLAAVGCQVAWTTAQRYFRRFKAAGLPRAQRLRQRARFARRPGPKLPGLPVYTGPEWIG